jgi:Recombination endonuclease VII
MSTEAMKRCPRCGETKDESDFHRDRKRGRPTSWCKSCNKAKSSAYYAANREKANAAHREYVRQNPERVAIQKACSHFGITREEWDAMPMVCVICRATDHLCIDHSHQTGRVRGRLCHACNKGLGFFRDNPSLLLRAADYVLGFAEPDLFDATHEPADELVDGGA